MRKRAFALIVVLLLAALLLVLGMAYMSKQSHRYRTARLAADAMIAKGLAEAGLEDTRVKLEHDLLYPPPDQRYHDEYSYAQTIYDLDGTSPVGNFEVTVDRRWMEPPFQVMVLISEGHPVNTRSYYRIRAELDLKPGSGTYFRFLRWEENAVY